MSKHAHFVALTITAIMLVAASFVIVSTAYNAAMEKRAESLLKRATWTPPKIDCPAGMELWDCIRHGRYE